MSLFHNNPLIGASGSGTDEYTIERSLRFNKDDSAHLSRIFSSTGSRTTFTISAWFKRVDLPSSQYIFVGGSGTNSYLMLDGNQLRFLLDGGTTGQLKTNAVYRDTSAWMHVVAVGDSTNATSGDRLRMYVNGERITDFATETQPSQSANLGDFNIAAVHYFNRLTSGSYGNIYLADCIFLDGTAATASDFGEFDDNNVWQPIEYTGTYGSNGFHLPFSDNSTAAALGTDTSGNGNTWTVNNISVTAGADNDSLFDSPQNGTQTDTGAGGEVSGNYATLQPLDLGSINTLTNGNLQVTSTTGANWSNGKSCGTIGVSSGKWYWEHTQNNSQYTYTGVGNIKSGKLDDYAGETANSYGWLSHTSTTYNNASGTSSNAPSMPTGGGTVMIALDLDNGKIWWGLDGTWVTSGSSPNPATGTDPAYSGLDTTQTWFPLTGLYNSMDLTFNFGQRPFAYAAPSGFKALCTTNLDDPTIADGSTEMDVVLYNANGSTQTISGLGFSPDLVWSKSRNRAYPHGLHDSVRGAYKYIRSNGTDTETDTSGDPATYTLTSFDADGFSVGQDGGAGVINNNAAGATTYVAWAWNAGTSTVSNTDGDVTSSVRANTSAGFSIVKWNPDSNGQSVGHGLNAVPEFIMAKALDNGHSWRVYHKDLTSGKNLLLDTNQVEDVYLADIDIVNSTVFDGGQGLTGSSLNNNIAYCFTSVEDYSSFGSYTGNNSTDGPFVYTGFRPRFLLVKGYDIAVSWQIYDSERNTFNLVDDELYPNLTDIENNQGVSGGFDFLSNGFKVRSVDSWLNSNSNNYIYAAFAERPFKYVRAQ